MMRALNHLILMLAIAATAACSSAPAAPTEASDEIAGKPPTPDNDPFFYLARPPASAKAETKGTIGEPGAEVPRNATSKRSQSGTAREVDDLRRRLALAEAAREEAEARIAELESGQATRAASSSRAAENQCFSCVRICPLDGKCDSDADMICGWGTGENRKDAMLRATTECDGALDLARKGNQWSRIDGKCPVAACN